MAEKRKIWNDPVTGDIVEVLETGKENNGERLRYRFTLKPGGFKPVLHIHEKQDEIFEVITGRLTYNLNGETQVAKAGETVTLPKGAAHTHYNGEINEDLVMIQSIRPAFDSETLIDSILGLTKDKKIINGKPKFLQVMVWLRYYKARTYLAQVPIALQNALAYVLAPIARMLGYKAAYKEYSGVDA
jgi:quercetin dioxygenase-like cupin family protein